MASFVPPVLSHVSWPIKNERGAEINYLNVHVFVNSRPGTPQHEFAKNIYKVILGYLSGGNSAPDDFINNSFLSIPAYNENKRLFENIMKRAPDFCGRSGMSTGYVSGSSTQNGYITVFITSTNGLIDPIFEKQPLHSVATMDITDGKILYIDSFCGAPKKNNFFDPTLRGEWNGNSGSAQNLGGWRLMKLLLRACQLQDIETVELMSMSHPDTLKFYEKQGFTNLDKGTKSNILQEHTRPVVKNHLQKNIKKIIAKLVDGKWEWKIEQAVLRAANAWLKNTGRQIDNLPMSMEQLRSIPMPVKQEKKNVTAAVVVEEEEDENNDWFTKMVNEELRNSSIEDEDNDWFTKMVNEKLGNRSATSNSSGTSNRSAAEPNWNEIVTPTISRQNSKEDPKLNSSSSSKASSSKASSSEASAYTRPTKKGGSKGGSRCKTKRRRTQRRIYTHRK